jgi:hypothetical protein
MGVTVVRYTTEPDRADENQALVEAVFAALAADQPEGLEYASYRLADGVSFVHVATVTRDDGVNPLTTTAAFGAFTAHIADRCVDGPVASDATLVGAYRSAERG